MATELKLRRGTTSQHSGFTGAEAEVTVDTDKETVVVHDGATTGGYPVAREDMSNVPDDTISGDQIAGGDATFDSINVDSGTLFVDSANNRVGVGTSSPSSVLTVDTVSAGTFTVEPLFTTSVKLKSDTVLGIDSVSGTRFYNDGSEAARIDSSGNLLVGTTSIDPAVLEEEGIAIRSGGFISLNRQDLRALRIGRSGSDGDIVEFRKDGSTVGSISVTSSSTSYNTSSDYRLKENVTDLSDGITRLKNLPVHQFNFIAEPDKTVDGFLAHEVQPYVPEAISGEKDEVEAIGDITDSDGEIIEEGVTEPTELKEGQTWTQTGDQPVYQGIDQAKLVPLLTAALQEAVGKIEQQQTQIDDLLARVTALETG